MKIEEKSATKTIPESIKGVESKSPIAKSRDGKVLISGFFHPSVRQGLKYLALATSKTQEELIKEALDLLFERHQRVFMEIEPFKIGSTNANGAAIHQKS
jgi:hypothetical protein